ncbi:MAG: hypothetical protein MHM6MM_004023 [Cercozoa sp. M6MM]
MSDAPEEVSSRRPEDEKVGDKRDYFWPHLPVDKRSKMQVDAEALFSVSNYKDAMWQARFICDLSKDKAGASVTDGTACVGGDSLALAAVFAKLNSVEYDRSRYDMLQNNLKVALSPENLQKVSFLTGDFNALVASGQLRQQILFLDPPWGGEDYLKSKKLVLRLGSKHLGDCIMNAKTAAPELQIVALKLPKNIDLADLQRHLKGCRGLEVRMRKWILVVLDFWRNDVTFQTKFQELARELRKERCVVKVLDQIEMPLHLPWDDDVATHAKALSTVEQIEHAHEVSHDLQVRDIDPMDHIEVHYGELLSSAPVSPAFVEHCDKIVAHASEMLGCPVSDYFRAEEAVSRHDQLRDVVAVAPHFCGIEVLMYAHKSDLFFLRPVGVPTKGCGHSTDSGIRVDVVSSALRRLLLPWMVRHKGGTLLGGVFTWNRARQATIDDKGAVPFSASEDRPALTFILEHCMQLSGYAAAELPAKFPNLKLTDPVNGPCEAVQEAFVTYKDMANKKRAEMRKAPLVFPFGILARACMEERPQNVVSVLGTDRNRVSSRDVVLREFESEDGLAFAMDGVSVFAAAETGEYASDGAIGQKRRRMTSVPRRRHLVYRQYSVMVSVRIEDQTQFRRHQQEQEQLQLFAEACTAEGHTILVPIGKCRRKPRVVQAALDNLGLARFMFSQESGMWELVDTDTTVCSSLDRHVAPALERACARGTLLPKAELIKALRDRDRLRLGQP